MHRLPPSWKTLALILIAALGVAGSRALHEFSGHGAASIAAWSADCETAPAAPGCPAPADDRTSHDDCLFCQSKTTSVATVVTLADSTFLKAPEELGVAALFEDTPVLVDGAQPRSSRAPPIA